MFFHAYKTFHHANEGFNNERVYHPNMKFNKSRMEYTENNERFLTVTEERTRARLEMWARRWP